MQLLACIPDPVDQVRLHEAVDIFILICDPEAAVLHIPANALESIDDLRFLLLCQNPLLCKHRNVSDTSADILFIESFVKGDRSIKIIH